MKIRSRSLGVVALVMAVLMVCTTLLTAGASTIPEDEISALINTSTDSSLVTSPFITVANQVRNSVVGVNRYTTTTTSYYGFYGYGYRQGEQRESLSGTGSGVVVSKYGHVLTNYHVVEDASRVTVTIANSESEYDAQVVGFDADLDIAVLWVPELDLPAVPLGDSDQLQVGEWAIVIGNPLGEEFARTLTVGVVSAIDRQITDTTYDRYGRQTEITNTMIQVDAAINSGNSGGGMFNTLGQLQGIPARKYSSSGLFSTTIDNIGMCIPINVAKPLLTEVLRAYDPSAAPQSAPGSEDDSAVANSPLHGKPRLGISGSTITSSFQAKLPQGVFVHQVEDGSPAQEGGILPGDIIVEVNETIISSMTALQDQLKTCSEGDSLQLKVYRAEGLAQFAGQNTIDLSQVGTGEYVDLQVVLRVIDNLSM